MAVSNPLTALDPSIDFTRQRYLTLLWQLTIFIVVKLVLEVFLTRSPHVMKMVADMKAELLALVMAKIPNKFLSAFIQECVRLAPVAINAVLCGIFVGICLVMANSYFKDYYLWIAGKFPTRVALVLAASEFFSMIVLALISYLVFIAYRFIHNMLDRLMPTLSWYEFIDSFAPGVFYNRENFLFFVVSVSMAAMVVGVSYSLLNVTTSTSGGPNQYAVTGSMLGPVFHYQAFLVTAYIVMVFIAFDY